MKEIILKGGNSSTVIKSGDTVRKMQGPWSSTIQRLLIHLKREGFAFSPTFLGIDDQEREILSFIEGKCGFAPYIFDSLLIEQTAKLLRQYHEVTKGFQRHKNDVWQLQLPEAKQPVICHNDFAPYNIIFKNNLPTGVIDFENACPGDPVWDVAFTCYWFIPLSFSKLHKVTEVELIERSERLIAFCKFYGNMDANFVIDHIDKRLKLLCETIALRSEQGNTFFTKMIQDGHLDFYKREIEHFAIIKPNLQLKVKKLQTKLS